MVQCLVLCTPNAGSLGSIPVQGCGIWWHVWQRHHFPAKVHIVKAMLLLLLFFPVVTYRCESWTVKKVSTKELISNCGAGEELESPLDYKIKLVNPKGNQPWIFIGRTDAKAEAPIFGPPDKKSWCWERLKVKQERDSRFWDVLDSITNSKEMN